MASPAPIACIQKQRLLEEFERAVAEQHRLQAARTAAMLRGEDFLFEKEITWAALQRENVKYAILAHQHEHGC
jgi:hypothetical protein